MRQRDDWHLTEALHNDQGRGDPFAAAVRATRMAMIITDPAQDDNPIVFANEAFQTLTGYGRDEVIGRNCRFLQGADTDRAAVARVREAIEGGRDIALDLLNYRKDGTTFWNALYISPVRNDAGEIVFFFASQLDVTDRIEAQARIEREVAARTADLEEALRTRTLLLHEVDHRVKNNLTMVGSLLRLQARSIADPAITARLEAMLERIDAMATIHRRLYQSDDISRFDIGGFVETLAADVLGASGRGNIALDLDIQPVSVDAGRASSLGLIVNEVLTNAVKHAYADGRGGRLAVSVVDEGAGRARIEVRDDGPGIGPGGLGGNGLGRTLITRLARQVEAETMVEDAYPGTRVVIRLAPDDRG